MNTVTFTNKDFTAVRHQSTKRTSTIDKCKHTELLARPFCVLSF